MNQQFPEVVVSADKKQVGGAQVVFQRHIRNESTQAWLQERVVRIPFAGCWVWTQSECLRGGYGQVGHGTYGTNKAHRLSYAAFHGDCTGYWVCHSCDNPACINADHLFLGDAMDNHLDMVRKGRGNYARIAKRMRKLGPQQVREIRASSLSQVALGALYGVSSGTIGQIRRLQQYKEIV